MKLFTVGALLLVSMILVACNVSTRAPGKDEYDPLKIGYFHDSRTGLCYAVISYDRMATNGQTASGLAHTNVPCSEKVVGLLQR